MFFLIIGAAPIFIIGLCAGIGLTMFFTTLFLSYANGIPLTQPLHICVEMYLQMNKFWFKLTRKSFRITHKSIQNALNIEKLKNIPYVRVLPMTTPSKEAQFWDRLLINEKQRFFISELKKKYNPNRIAMLRDHMAFSEPMFSLIRDNLCKITIETVKNIPIHWIEYEGSTIDNGLILAIHGGGTYKQIYTRSLTHSYTYSQLNAHRLRCWHAINAILSLLRIIQINWLCLCIYRLSVMSGNSHSTNYNYRFIE